MTVHIFENETCPSCNEGTVTRCGKSTFVQCDECGSHW